MVQPEDVVVEESAEVLSRRRDLVEPEELPHEADVGAPGKLQVAEPVRCLELSSEGSGESLDPRAARMDQRAVDIE